MSNEPDTSDVPETSNEQEKIPPPPPPPPLRLVRGAEDLSYLTKIDKNEE
jgi:hypothetical protein